MSKVFVKSVSNKDEDRTCPFCHSENIETQGEEWWTDENGTHLYDADQLCRDCGKPHIRNTEDIEGDWLVFTKIPPA